VAGQWLNTLIEQDYGVVCATSRTVHIKDKHNILLDLNLLQLTASIKAIDAHGQYIAVLL
jgi:hypothetical protein